MKFNFDFKKIKQVFNKKNFSWANIFVYIKKNNKQLKKYYYYILLPIAFLLIGYSMVFMANSNNFNLVQKTVRIERNSSANDILFQLKREGIVRNKIYAKLAILLTSWHKHIYAGKYTLSPSMSTRQIFMTLMGRYGIGEEDMVHVVIPEGYSMKEIVERLDREKIIDKEAFYNYLLEMDKNNWQMKYGFLMDNKLENDKFFEGYLYPDTYSFVENSSPAVVLDAMLKNFQKNIVPLLVENNTGLNTHKLITMASIIEKEAVVQEERPIISGVFYNRLKYRMYLGSCPTVKYAMGKPHKKYLLYKDLEVRSPYNTYRNLGLPPGPICSPGKAAVLAALNPAETKYLYFVARGDGTHIFSYSGAEHVRNKNKVNSGRIY